jgi:hypothetical protein
MDDVAEAVAAVKRDLIGGLPKMRRAGRTDVSDLKVSVNALRRDAAATAGREAAATPRVIRGGPVRRWHARATAR